MVIVTSPLTLDWTTEATVTEEDTDSAYSPVLHYKDWLPEWNQLIARAPTRPCIPSTACIISTPLNLHHWSCSLESYPNRALADFFLQGISEGFRIGFSYGSNHLKPSQSNLAGAHSHPNVVEDYLQAEVSLRRVAGPFLSSLLPNCQISRFGVILKNHQPGKWRLIVDLSHPKGKSVNDGIPKHLCSLKYITLEDAVQQILTLGPGTLLAKIDIKSAFRLLPVHPADRHLLGMKWNGEIYLDSCLPFGLRSAPRLLGITLDTVRMEARLPVDKLQRTQEQVGSWMQKKKATKREILSLVGILQHATKIVRSGRTFLSRMYATAAKLREMHFYTRLNKEFRSDLCWWDIFLESWNGISLLQCTTTLTPTAHELSIQTDASSSWGCGAFFEGRWLQIRVVQTVVHRVHHGQGIAAYCS